MLASSSSALAKSLPLRFAIFLTHHRLKLPCASIDHLMITLFHLATGRLPELPECLEVLYQSPVCQRPLKA
jgi:hypothetical protein